MTSQTGIGTSGIVDSAVAQTMLRGADLRGEHVVMHGNPAGTRMRGVGDDGGIILDSGRSGVGGNPMLVSKTGAEAGRATRVSVGVTGVGVFAGPYDRHMDLISVDVLQRTLNTDKETHQANAGQRHALHFQLRDVR